MIIEGESLFNDGTAAVVFAIVLAAVVDGGSVGAAAAVGRFIWMAAGGMAVGLAVGYIASAFHRSQRIPLPFSRAVSVLQNASVGPLPMSKPRALNVG